jgi:hypothetical protein
MSHEREIIGAVLSIPIYILPALAIYRRARYAGSEPTFRSKLVPIALAALVVNLLFLTGEFIYRVVFGYRPWLGFTIVNIGFLSCLAALILCVVGRGRGRIELVITSCLLMYAWAVHLAV